MIKTLLIDTETTSLEDPRLVQVAYEYNHTHNQYTKVEKLFKPTNPIDYGAMAIHHITNAMVLNLEPFGGSETQSEIIRLIGEGYILIAHNAPFDIGVLRAEGIPEPRFWVDTKRCAMHLTKSDYHNLQYLRYSLDLKVTDYAPDQIVRAHDAGGDVTVLKSLFFYLMELADKELEHRGFYQNATQEEREKASLTHLINLSRQPVLIRIAKFGKYKGMAWSEIASKHMDYIDWLYRQKKDETPDNPDYDMDLMHTILYYLNN